MKKEVQSIGNKNGRQTVHVLRSREDIENCRPAWDRFQKHPNVAWDFYWHINGLHGCEACVLELKEDGETKSLWIGRLENARIPIRIGYAQLGAISIKQLNVITGGILGDESEASCVKLLEKARAALADLKAQMLVLSYIPARHSLYRLATRTPNFACRDLGVVPSQHWRLTLPETFETFLKLRSRKHRYWLNRIPRVLEDAFPGQIQINAYRTIEEVEEFWRSAGAVAESTYQHALGESFRADADFRARCEILAKRNELRGYILAVAGKPVAYWLATASQDTVYLNFTGYLPEFRKFEPGTILLMKLFEEHCGSPSPIVDFGHGSSSYKERFGDESFDEAAIRIYRSSLRGAGINLFTGLQAKTKHLTVTLLSKMGLLQRIKTLWRKRLTPVAVPSKE